MKRLTDGVTRRIDALVAAMTGSGGPGAAVAVIQGGQLAYQGCFGLADLEWRQPVGPDTVFALASVSKPLTAMTVMLLARDGLIDIDAPVSSYLPGYPGPGRAVSLFNYVCKRGAVMLDETGVMPAERVTVRGQGRVGEGAGNRRRRNRGGQHEI